MNNKTTHTIFMYDYRKEESFVGGRDYPNYGEAKRVFDDLTKKLLKDGVIKGTFSTADEEIPVEVNCVELQDTLGLLLEKTEVTK